MLIKAPKTNKSLSEAVAGDLLCYNNGKLYIYPSSKFEGTPIGVVVIPTSHNVYGNGSCGVMSLVNMDKKTPDTGTTNENEGWFVWGANGVISSLSTYSAVVSIGNSSTISDSLQLVQNNNYNSILPSDGFTAFQNPFDTDTYYNTQEERYYYIPSPYKEDDSRNLQYSQTSVPSSNDTNALSDFNGKTNSIIMTDLATGQPNWKTDTTIENYDGTGYYPTACCCWRFHTVGTKQGDWYLPAIGELGYIMPKLNTIDSAIQKTGIGGKLIKFQHWSSTQYDYSYAFDLDTRDGCISSANYRYTSHRVRAFMQAGPDIVSE